MEKEEGRSDAAEEVGLGSSLLRTGIVAVPVGGIIGVFKLFIIGKYTAKRAAILAMLTSGGLYWATIERDLRKKKKEKQRKYFDSSFSFLYFLSMSIAIPPTIFLLFPLSRIFRRAKKDGLRERSTDLVVAHMIFVPFTAVTGLAVSPFLYWPYYYALRATLPSNQK